EKAPNCGGKVPCHPFETMRPIKHGGQVRACLDLGQELLPYVRVGKEQVDPLQQQLPVVVWLLEGGLKVPASLQGQRDFFKKDHDQSPEQLTVTAAAVKGCLLI